MQIKINIKLEQPCTLPITYHHIVQSAIYQLLLEDGQKRSNYHNQGVKYKNRIYRLFVFGPLKGKYQITDGKISFFNEMSLEIRSADMHFIYLLEHNLAKAGIRIWNKVYQNLEVFISDNTIEKSELMVKMESPICVYSTNPETKHTHFFSPNEPLFEKAIVGNFERKYMAATGAAPSSTIHIIPESVSERDKYVTRYKNFYISGWKGIYRLSGERKYLDFLFQTGLGSKNSQGFGMFSVLEDSI